MFSLTNDIEHAVVGDKLEFVCGTTGMMISSISSSFSNDTSCSAGCGKAHVVFFCALCL